MSVERSDYDPLGYCTEPGKRRRHKTRGDKARKGSRKAAMELACLHCMGWDATEVPKCTDPKCPLWLWTRKNES